MRDLVLDKQAKDYINRNRRWGNRWRKTRANFLKARKKADFPIILPEAILRCKLIRDNEAYNFGIVCRKKVTLKFSA